MNYKEALKDCYKDGVVHASREGFLAGMCQTLAAIHVINPGMVYLGANAKGLTGNELAKLNESALGDLMFEGMDT